MYSNVNAMGCYPVTGKITKEDVGLGNVDNTSDLDKPISNAMREIVDRMEQAVTDVNEAVETANEASESAQESAESVAGYNSRLTSAEIRLTTTEDEIAGNTSNITTLDGEIETVQQDLVNINEHLDYVDADLTNTVKKITSGSQNVTNGLTVGDIPNVGTGVVTRDYIDGYDQMLRTTGTQLFSGEKISRSTTVFTVENNGPSNAYNMKSLSDDSEIIPSQTINYPLIRWVDKNGKVVGIIRLEHNSNFGQYILVLYLLNSSSVGGYNPIELGRNIV